MVCARPKVSNQIGKDRKSLAERGGTRSAASQVRGVAAAHSAAGVPQLQLLLPSGAEVHAGGLCVGMLGGGKELGPFALWRNWSFLSDVESRPEGIYVHGVVVIHSIALATTLIRITVAHPQGRDRMHAPCWGDHRLSLIEHREHVRAEAIPPQLKSGFRSIHSGAPTPWQWQ